MDWLNRVGMLLEFLSFWFAAPEVVTEIRNDEGEWLRVLERKLETGLTRFSTVLEGVSFLFVGQAIYRRLKEEWSTTKESWEKELAKARSDIKGLWADSGEVLNIENREASSILRYFRYFLRILQFTGALFYFVPFILLVYFMILMVELQIALMALAGWAMSVAILVVPLVILSGILLVQKKHNWWVPAAGALTIVAIVVIALLTLVEVERLLRNPSTTTIITH